jgi:hypothetical protein
LHLDRGVIDLRQSRDGELPVGNEAYEEDADHEKGGGDRPQDERP